MDGMGERIPGGWQFMDTAPKAPEDSMECWNILGYWPGGIMAVVYWGKGGWWPANEDAEEPWAPPTLWHALPDEPPLQQVKESFRDYAVKLPVTS
jgi:hypothetical protein